MSTDPSYTVLVRLPFPRGDFVDPPDVDWDAAKDQALWKILLKAPKNTDINWNELATQFDVSLEFLLQQSAWLYENQFLQVREQMRKVGASKPSSASPAPGGISESTGGETMRRTGSGGGQAAPRAPSTLSAGRESSTPKIDSITNTAGRPAASSPRPTTAFQRTRSNPQTTPQIETHQQQRDSPPLESPSPPMSSSSSSSSSSSPAVQSRLARRPQYLASNRDKREASDDDDDDEPAFMPFTAAPPQDPSATLRGDPGTPARRPHRGKAEVSQASDSSTSSASPAVNRRPVGQRRSVPGPLSPRRTAELAGRREGSDGTPSMGSSFSDLDDTSITQSALEEALASNMRAGGGMASRMSSISQALRSKYL